MPASLLELFDGRTEAIAGRLAATIPYAIIGAADEADAKATACALYTSPSPRDRQKSRMP